jgi:hypothetical protein
MTFFDDIGYKAAVRGHFPELSGLYAIQFDTGVKIGKASNLSSRIAIYLDPWCKDIKDFSYVTTECHHRAEEIAIAMCSNKWPKVENSREVFGVFGANYFKTVCCILKKAVFEAEKEADL